MVLSYATCGNRDVLLRISRLALGSLNLVVKGAESKLEGCEDDAENLRAELKEAESAEHSTNLWKVHSQKSQTEEGAESLQKEQASE